MWYDVMWCDATWQKNGRILPTVFTDSVFLGVTGDMGDMMRGPRALVSTKKAITSPATSITALASSSMPLRGRGRARAGPWLLTLFWWPSRFSCISWIVILGFSVSFNLVDFSLAWNHNKVWRIYEYTWSMLEHRLRPYISSTALRRPLPPSFLGCIWESTQGRGCCMSSTAFSFSFLLTTRKLSPWRGWGAHPGVHVGALKPGLPALPTICRYCTTPRVSAPILRDRMITRPAGRLTPAARVLVAIKTLTAPGQESVLR